MFYLITGAAGFIGFHLSLKLLEEGKKVIGVDNLNPYYDVNLKKSRLDLLKSKFPSNFIFYKLNIEDKEDLFGKLYEFDIDFIINLAAQAGVRYSLINPYSYIDSNICGFINILELSKKKKIKHLVYASSSSVYGGNTNIPFKESDPVDSPVSLYAATKKSNELMAHTYSHLFGIPSTGLRFFTVYGPWGRPDMALFIFTKAIFEGRKIDVFNYGDMTRDFTYIDDVIESLRRVIKKPPSSMQKKKSDNKNIKNVPHHIFNVGNSDPKTLIEYINLIEKYVGKEADKNYLPIQPGDVQTTYANTNSLESWINFKPNTSLEKGIDSFIKWYRKFYDIL